MTRPASPVLALLAGLLLAGCASLPADRGRGELAARLPAGTTLPDPAQAAPLPELPTGPLGPDDAVALALAASPAVRAILAGLGQAAADRFESGRIHNPRLSLGRLGEERHAGLDVVLSDLLSLPARSRIGAERWQADLAQSAHALQAYAGQVRAAWYRLVAAGQIAGLRAAVADAAGARVELARRFHAAGNISALQLAREEAAATLARTDAARARSERLAARMALAELTGLAGRSNAWRTPERLPLPAGEPPAVAALLAGTAEHRQDLAAARAALAAGERGRRLARRLAWLGEIELGVEREREGDERRSGASIALELPLFHQGQARRARADADLAAADAQVAALQLAVQRQVRTAAERVATRRGIVETYRDALLPQRKAIVEREQERYDFMLIGAFDLIAARQQEYDAWQAWLEAIRDYWLAVVELELAAGRPLPQLHAGTDSAGSADVLAPPDAGGGHDHHHQHQLNGDTP